MGGSWRCVNPFFFCPTDLIGSICWLWDWSYGRLINGVVAVATPHPVTAEAAWKCPAAKGMAGVDIEFG